MLGRNRTRACPDRNASRRKPVLAAARPRIRRQGRDDLGRFAIAVARRLGHHVFQRDGDSPWDRAPGAHQRRGTVDQMPLDLGRRRSVFRPAERRITGQQEVKRATQAVNIGANVGVMRVAGLLGGDKIERAQHLAGEGQRRRIAREAGDPKINQLDHALAINEQIGRLDVAVHQADLVGVLQSQGGLQDDFAGVRRRKRSAPGDQLRNVFALHEISDQVTQASVLPGVGGANDMGVVERANRARLCLETARPSRDRPLLAAR